jgi:hypothetical protein
MGRKQLALSDWNNCRQRGYRDPCRTRQGFCRSLLHGPAGRHSWALGTDASAEMLESLPTLGGGLSACGFGGTASIIMHVSPTSHSEIMRAFSGTARPMLSVCLILHFSSRFLFSPDGVPIIILPIPVPQTYLSLSPSAFETRSHPFLCLVPQARPSSASIPPGLQQRDGQVSSHARLARARLFVCCWQNWLARPLSASLHAPAPSDHRQNDHPLSAHSILSCG